MKFNITVGPHAWFDNAKIGKPTTGWFWCAQGETESTTVRPYLRRRGTALTREEALVNAERAADEMSQAIEYKYEPSR